MQNKDTDFSFRKVFLGRENTFLSLFVAVFSYLYTDPLEYGRRTETSLKMKNIDFIVRFRRSGCVSLLVGLLWAGGCDSRREGVRIEADLQEIEMGRTLQVRARYVPPVGGAVGDVILMPYVNGRRWGAHEFPDSSGRALLLLPLPEVGPAEIEVVAVPRDTSSWCGLRDYRPYLTGRLRTGNGVVSNKLSVGVRWRDIPRRPAHPTAFVAQWEPWFAPGAMWTTAQAVPLLGFYDFTDPSVLRQHLLWLIDSGADAVLFDWSNHIWNCRHWNDRGDGVNRIVHATSLALETMADMRDEGLPVPQAVIMPGLSNGPPGTMQALNEELDWIYHYYIRNPRFDGLWFLYDGKPLVTILDTGVTGVKEGRTETAFRIPFFEQTLGWPAERIDAVRKANPPVDDSRFTVRWMSSQNQATGHDSVGYWSWMDGSLEPTVTYRDGVAECTTVNPACFAGNGWTSPEAWGRSDGWTYLESFKVALKHRPRVVMLHQFNEFTGQGAHGYGPERDIFVDSYSVEFSDDYEPVSPTAPGFRGDRGGWGFYYLNLSRAMTDVYNGEADGTTVMAVAPVDVRDGEVSVRWTTVGADPAGFSVDVDGEIVERGISGSGIVFPAGRFAPGEHRLKVTAEGATTRYALGLYELDTPSVEPMPVTVEKTFFVE